MISEKVNEIIEKSRSTYSYVSDNEDTAFSPYSEKDIIKKVKFYQNDRFFRGGDDSKIFFNIAKPRSPHFAKNLNIDTKDLLPYGIGDVNYIQSWILRTEFRKWMDDEKIGKLLNKLTDYISDFGSAIIRVDQKKIVDLSDIYFDPTTEELTSSCPVVIMHYLTKSQLEEKEDVWEKVEDIKPDEKGIYEVWEYWGMCEGKYQQVIGSGSGDDELIHFEVDRKEKEFPFFDFHIHEYKGRWLRQGLYERLFDLQKRMNQLINENAKSSEIASLILFRTTDTELANANMIEDAMTGQVINSTDLQQLPLDKRDISNFVNEFNIIQKQADDLCLTPEVVTGDEMPSGTTFRGQALTQITARTTFRDIKDNMGIQLAYIIKNIWLPKIVKGWKNEHILDIARNSQDIAIYVDALTEQRTLEFLKKANMTGSATEEDIQAVRDLVIEQSRRGELKVTVPKDFFNFEFGIKTNITGESENKQVKNDARVNAMNTATMMPAMTKTPLWRQHMEDNGLEWWQLTSQEIEEIQGKQVKPVESVTEVERIAG